MNAADRRRRAADYRQAATRTRRQADQIRAAIDHPNRHPPITPGTVTGMPTFDHLLATYAHQPATGRAAAKQLDELADALDHRAAEILSRAYPPKATTTTTKETTR